jgi:hypothetical protein
MPCDNLRDLMEEINPGVSTRQLTRAAGVDNNRLAYWLKPSTVVDSMPSLAVCKEIARIIGADLAQVVEAFALDIGYPWGALDDPVLREIARLHQRMTADDRTTHLAVCRSLAGARR